jgi:hypothetical protein
MQAPDRDLRSSCTLNNYIRRFLTDHVDRQYNVKARNLRKDTSVNHSQTLDTLHSELRIQHRHRIRICADGTCAACMVAPCLVFNEVLHLSFCRDIWTRPDFSERSVERDEVFKCLARVLHSFVDSLQVLPGCIVSCDSCVKGVEIDDWYVSRIT